jgi:membrane fusion protein (multidrug efflux system)
MLSAQYRSGRACSLILATFFALAGCGRGQESRAQPPDGGAEAIGVVTGPVVRKALGVEIEAVGTARANESVDVTSKAANTVVAIRFHEGDLVRRGAVLVELDAAAARATLAEAEAALAESENNYKRSRDLYTSRALSESQLDQIEAMLKGNRARLAAAQAQLDDTIIRASFDGRTGFRQVSVGSLVSPGTVITTLDDTSVINLDFTVPETYLYLLERGLAVAASAAGLPGRRFEGEVTNLGSRVDPVTRSIRVRAEIPNRDGVLRPGMFMTVKLQGQVAPTLVAPEGAIVPEQGRTYTFLVRDGVVERREVKLGKRRPGEVEILEGLEEHERVVVEGTQKVREGSRVVELDRTDPPSS